MHTCIYLNNAATSFPKPDVVVAAVGAMLRAAPYQQGRSVCGEYDIMSACRSQLALMFGAQTPNRIVFASGATEALNLAIRGLLAGGGNAVTTAVEHNSVLRPLRTLERDAGNVTLTVVGCDRDGLVRVGDIESAIRRDTVAVIVNHCSNVTGVVNDIGEIGLMCKRRGVNFVVDASQSAGVHEIDVERMEIDVLAFTGHKALCGIQGIGGAYIRDGVALRPLKVGGTGARSDYAFQPETVPMLYEAGTQNLPGIVSLHEGVRYVQGIGVGQIRKRKEDIVRHMRAGLARNPRLALYPKSETATTLLSFTIRGMDTDDIGYVLESNYRIVARCGLHCAPLIHEYIGSLPDGCVRISPSHFTTDDEVSIFIDAMDQIMRMCG